MRRAPQASGPTTLLHSTSEETNSRSPRARAQLPGGYRQRMAVDEELLAELRQTKSEIDRLQAQLKDVVARLRDSGATTEEITQALRG